MQLKKVINLGLALIILISNIGYSFTIHYCENKIASVTFNTASNVNETEKTCCGTTELTSKCCKNKIVKSVAKYDTIVSKSISFDPVLYLISNQSHVQITSLAFYATIKNSESYFCDANAPPLYLLYSQYTFYA